MTMDLVQGARAVDNTLGTWCAPGFCGTTRDGPGNCDRGSSGSWRASRFGIRTPEDCAAKCRACTRCRFVSMSLSAVHDECAWYASCDALEKPPPTGPDYFSLHVLKNDTDRHGAHRGTSCAAHESLRGVSIAEGFARRANLTAVRHQLRRAVERSSGDGDIPINNRYTALLMHGIIAQPGAQLQEEAGGDHRQALRKVVTRSHASLTQWLFQPNAHAGVTIETFIHSWNPDLAQLIDATYRPVSSRHERPHRVTVSFTSVTSQMLSLSHALRLKRAREEATGQTFELVLVMRHDLLLRKELLLRSLDPRRYWFARRCCEFGKLRLAPDCGSGPSGRPADPCAVKAFARERTDVSIAVNHNYFVEDWMFATSSARADSFEAIYLNHSVYQQWMWSLGISYHWAHFYWSAHLIDFVHAASDVRFLPLQSAVDVALVRHTEDARCLPPSVRSAAPELRGDIEYDVTELNLLQLQCPYFGEIVLCTPRAALCVNLSSGNENAWLSNPAVRRGRGLP